MVETESKYKRMNRQGTIHRAFKFLAWFNGLAAIVLALLLALPSFIDWGQYKEEIILSSQEKLGIEVKIEGAVYAQFLPVPVLKLNRVILANSADIHSSPVTVKRVDVELNFLSFVQGEFKPRAFLLHEADFHIGLAEDKSWLSPVGLKEMILGAGSHTISRFGVKRSRISFLKNPSQEGYVLQNVNFVAEKSADINNWSLEGYFYGFDEKHSFQLITRSRPERKTTYIDTRVKMNSGGDVIHNFNGSLNAQYPGIVLAGIYKAAGRYGLEEEAITLSARSQIMVSDTEVNLSGSTVSLAHLASAQNENGIRPATLNADIKMKRNQGVGKWKIKSDLSADNFSSELFAPFLSENFKPMQVFHKLNELAVFVDGELSVRNKRFKTSNSFLPHLWANFHFTNDLVHISDSGVSLPGGGSLQTERLQGEHKTTSGSKEVIHTGNIYLKSENAGDLAILLPSIFSQKNYQDLSFAKTPISLSGLLQLGPGQLNLKTKNLTVNGANGRARLDLKTGKNSKVNLYLNMEKINADRFFNSTQNSFVSVISDLNKQIYQGSGDTHNTRVAKLHINADTLFWRGTAMNNFRLKGNFSKDKLTLTRLSAGGASEAGLKLAMKGEVKNLSSNPKGSFEIDLESRQAVDALSLLNPQFLVSKQGRHLSKRSHLISPVSFKAQFSSEGKEEVSDQWRVYMDGQIASTNFTSQGAFEPNFNTTGQLLKNIDMQFEASNESSRALARQIFSIKHEALELVPDAEGYIRATVSGSHDQGYDIAFGGEVSDVQVTLGGNVKFVNGAPAVSAQVKLIAPDSRSLLGFAGVKSKKNLGKTNYIANLAGSGDAYVLSGGRGLLWGRPANIEARMDLASLKPVLSASISTGEITIPAILAVKEMAIDVPNADKNPLRYFDTHISFATPLLSVYDGVDVESAQANFKLSGNKLTLSQFTGQLYGGKIVLNGSLERREGSLALAAQYELQDAHFERALIQENLDKIAKGQFTIAGEVTGSARNWGKLGHSLKGRGYIKGRKGEIGGIDPAAFGRSVRFVSNGTELDGMIGGILTQGSLPYSQFQTAFTINDSVLETSKTQLISREVRSKNKTRINLVSGKINSDWQLQILRLPNTPKIKLSYEGTRYKLRRNLQHKKMRNHLMALMRKGENLSQRFAAQSLGKNQKVDPVQTGSIKRKMMEKPIKLDGLNIVPKVNPLRGSK